MTAVDVQVAAHVGDDVITATEVDARLAALRDGAFGSRLPGPHTAEGRNARRWVLQLMCAEHLVQAELARRGISSRPKTNSVALPRVLMVGGVAAAVLTAFPSAAELVEPPEPEERELRAYYDRNRDLFADGGVPFETARDSIAAELQLATIDRAFGEWLESRMARDVRLAPGFEHPAEPGHRDSTHRH